MRIVILFLLLAVLLTGPLAASNYTKASVTSPDSTIVVAGNPGPTTLLDGIDWDEWFENMLDGIDWDEWFESIGLKPATTT